MTSEDQNQDTAQRRHLDDLVEGIASVARRHRNPDVLDFIGTVGEPVHTIAIKDLRQRYGDPEQFLAQCACGWTGDVHSDRFGERAAGRDGNRHIEEQRRGRNGRPAPRQL